MVKRKKHSVYLACCLQSSAKMAGVYFVLWLHAGLRGRTEQNTGFDVLSLTWPERGIPAPLWHHNGLLHRTACASVNYTKGAARKRSEGWTFIISSEFLDRTCFCWRTFTSQMNFLKRGRHCEPEAVRSCVWGCVKVVAGRNKKLKL